MKPITPYENIAADDHPLTEIEAALEPLETSWVDFLYGVRRRRRYIRAEHRRGSLGMGLATVHRKLDGYRQQFEAGERLAIWTALICCIQENVPLPYWLGDAILDINKKVNRGPSSLHDLFGFESRLPAKGKKADTTRRDLQWRGKLWSAAKTLMVEHGPLSRDAAVKRAREQLNIPYSSRKCIDMFDEQDRIQRANDDAWKGRKTHHAK